MNLPVKISGLGCLAFAATIVTAGFAAAPAQAGGPPPAPVYSWTGFYAGVHGGWGWANTEIQDQVVFNSIYNPLVYTYDGPLAGVQLGANYQMGNFVVGAEIDGSWSFVRGRGYPPIASDQGVIQSTQKNLLSYRSFATVTGRVGYTMGQWLAYVKGGAAAADMEIVASYQAQPTSDSRSLVGWTAGAGLEVAFLRNVSAKAEYNFIRLPVDNLHYAYWNDFSSLEHFVHVVKVGVNVRFGGDAGLLR